MEAAVIVICVVLDIPTGALADVIGAKKSLIIGRVILLMSTILFAIMESPAGAWIANITWAVGYSFQSGADHTLMYSTLKGAGIAKSFTKVEGCAVGSRFLLIAFCSLAVGPMAEFSLRLPMLACIPFAVIPLIVSFFLKEDRTEVKYSVRKQLDVLRRGVMYAIRKPEVRWIIGLCALIVGASKIWFFTYNPYFEKVNLPLSSFGVIFFFLNVVAFLSSRYAHKLEKRFKEKVCVAAMILCIGLPILLMGLFPYWPMALLVVVQNVVRGFIGPFVANFTNKHIDSDEIRATALSVRSTLTSSVTILALFWFGFMDKSFGLLPSLIVLGIVVLVLGRLSYARYKSLFSETSVRK
jgi:MFS family permease